MTCIWVCHSMFKVQAKHHISWRSGAFQRPACRVSKLYFDGKCLGSVKVHPLPNLHLSPICRTEMIQLSNFNTKETSDLDLNFQMVERSKSGADEHGRGWKSVPWVVLDSFICIFNVRWVGGLVRSKRNVGVGIKGVSSRFGRACEQICCTICL